MLSRFWIIVTICCNLQSIDAQKCHMGASSPARNGAKLATTLSTVGSYSCGGVSLSARDLKWWLEQYTSQDNFWFGSDCDHVEKLYKTVIKFPKKVPDECNRPQGGWDAFTKDYVINDKHTLAVWGVAVPTNNGPPFNTYWVYPCSLALRTVQDNKDQTWEICPWKP